MNQTTKKYLLAAIALVAAAGILFAVWFFMRPAAEQGSKALTIEVVHGDGTTKAFPIRTDAQFLADALLEHELVAGEETAFGLFITTCDGETVDPANEEWWRLSKNGEDLMVGADAEPIADGGKYEITLTVGYGA